MRWWPVTCERWRWILCSSSAVEFMRAIWIHMKSWYFSNNYGKRKITILETRPIFPGPCSPLQWLWEKDGERVILKDSCPHDSPHPHRRAVRFGCVWLSLDPKRACSIPCSVSSCIPRCKCLFKHSWSTRKWLIYFLIVPWCMSVKTLDTMEMQCWRLHLGMIEKRLHSESGWTSWAGCVESAWPVQDCKYIYIDTLKITHQDPSFGCVWHRSHLIAAVCTRNHKWKSEHS